MNQQLWFNVLLFYQLKLSSYLSANVTSSDICGGDKANLVIYIYLLFPFFQKYLSEFGNVVVPWRLYLVAESAMFSARSTRTPFQMEMLIHISGTESASASECCNNCIRAS